MTAATLAENLLTTIKDEAEKSQTAIATRLMQSYNAYSKVSNAVDKQIEITKKIRQSP